MYDDNNIFSCTHQGCYCVIPTSAIIYGCAGVYSVVHPAPYILTRLFIYNATAHTLRAFGGSTSPSAPLPRTNNSRFNICF